MAGSAAFQMDGAVALFGQDIFELNLDTIGLWFGTKSHKDVQLLQESNLEKGFALEASQTEVSDLGQRLRRPLDPQCRPYPSHKPTDCSVASRAGRGPGVSESCALMLLC